MSKTSRRKWNCIVEQEEVCVSASGHCISTAYTYTYALAHTMNVCIYRTMHNDIEDPADSLFPWMSSVCVSNRLNYNGESILHSLVWMLHMVPLQEVRRREKRKRVITTILHMYICEHHSVWVAVYALLLMQFRHDCARVWCTKRTRNKDKHATNQPTNQPSNGKAMKAMEMETRLKTALSNYWNMWHRIIPTYCVCLNATRTAAILFHSLHIWLLNLFLQRQVFSAKLETTETLMKWICNTDYIVIASSLSLSLSKIMAVQNISFLTLIGIKLC